MGDERMAGSSSLESSATAHPPAQRRTIRSVGVASVAGYGALLSAVFALVQGLVVLIGATLNSDTTITWQHAILFAGVGFVGLVFAVAIAAVVGAISGALAALVYNFIAHYSGGIQIDLE